jgi:hypothetical protein
MFCESFMKAFPFVFATLFALAGCSAMPVTSMIALSKIDPATTDLTRLRIALSVPDAMQPSPGGVWMDVTITRGNAAPEKKVIHLDETNDAADRVGLTTVGGGQTIYAYKLSPEGIAELDALRRSAAESKANGQGGSIGIGVAAREFCLEHTLPQGQLLATTWMATSETKTYVVVARNFDLRSDKRVADGLKEMQPCSE